jgi:hypothetical protein
MEILFINAACFSEYSWIKFMWRSKIQPTQTDEKIEIRTLTMNWRCEEEAPDENCVPEIMSLGHIQDLV